MAAGIEPESVFDGSWEIIDRFLGLGEGESLKQKSTARGLPGAPPDQADFERLVLQLYELIETNWSGRIPSKENWRTERQTRLDSDNRSPEVLLERAIALLGDEGLLSDWFNQIPVASGLINDQADKRAAVDLMRLRDKKVAFVELKWASDTPVYAALEILLYGLAFVFSFEHREKLGYQGCPLMVVNDVALEVLAPREFYTGYKLGWLQRGLDQAARTLSAKKSAGTIMMSFNFLTFPRNFELPFAKGSEVLRLRSLDPDDPICQTLVSAVEGIERIQQN